MNLRNVLDERFISSLRDRFPDLEIDWIGDELMAKLDRVSSPERAMVRWCQNAQRDGTHRKGSQRPKQFAPPRVKAAPESPLVRGDESYTAFRLSIIRQILDDRISPKAVAEILRAHASKFAPLGLEDPLHREADLYAGADSWQDLRGKNVPTAEYDALESW